jgi:imidazole glycerol-phosphate synthase subunit HisF
MNLRVIPRLEIKGPNLVKGIQFDGLRVLGDPAAFAALYYREGADELIYVDIVASLYGRSISPDVVRRTAEHMFIPLTVGGGIRTLEDIETLLNAGADKVAINTGAVQNPDLIDEAAKAFGSQCIILAIEAKRAGHGYEPYIENGRQQTGLDALSWAKEGVSRGAGEILLTSVDQEGTHLGFDVPLCSLLKGAVNVPVIVAGGAGKVEHVASMLPNAEPDGVACASLFHYHYLEKVLSGSEQSRERVDFLRHQATQNPTEGKLIADFAPVSIPALKKALKADGIAVRG